MSSLVSSEAPTKVLHIGKYFTPHVGGMETYLRDLMVSLAAMGTETVALVHQSHIGVFSSEEEHSVAGLQIHIARAATWCRLIYTPISPTFPWLLSRLIKRYRPEVLHLHLPNPSAFWVLILPSARRIPWVIHWQSDALTPKSSRLLKLAYRLYAPLESALINRAQKIIATSAPYLETSKPLTRVKNKCEVVPLGIEDRFGNLSDKPVASPENRRSGATTLQPLQVLAIGRMTYYKGFDVLLRAIAQTSNVELDLVGEGDQSISLRRLAASLGVEGRTRFRGVLNNSTRDKLLSACDCLCLPSVDRAESFGLVILEAMSAAKASVVSDVLGSGMSALVDHERTGLVVPSNNAQALAEAFCYLRDNRTMSAEFGQNGRDKFLASLTIEQSAKAVQSIYRNLGS
jgi:glycosyltransferase involved in cell wall biosynthesis